MLSDESLENLASSVSASKIISISKLEKEEMSEDTHHIDVEVSILSTSKSPEKNPEPEIKTFQSKIRKTSYGTLRAIKEIAFECISKNLISEGERVICAANENIGIGYKGTTFILDVDKTIFKIATQHISEDIPVEVIESIVDISAEIAREGREGKKVGTAFVIGPKEDILNHVKQLILNPFLGHTEKKLKITDPSLRETVKEFSQLEGAFIIDKDGTIVTSGAYIEADTGDIELPGLGTRHRNAAAITKVTNSIAIVLSTSGTIRIFKEGKQVMKI